MYNIVYKWRGERHRSLIDHLNIKDARRELIEMRHKKFVAWIEKVL